MREGETDPRIELYQRTQAAEEGRLIPEGRAIREYNVAVELGVFRGINEYRRKDRPTYRFLINSDPAIHCSRTGKEYLRSK